MTQHDQAIALIDSSRRLLQLVIANDSLSPRFAYVDPLAPLGEIQITIANRV